MYSANLRTLLEKYGFVRNRGLKAAVFLCCLLPRHDATGSARNEASFLAVFSQRSAMRLKRLILPNHLLDSRPRFVEDLCEELRLIDGVRAIGDYRTNAAFTRRLPICLCIIAPVQGAGRPQVSRSLALFHGPQHYVASAAGRVRLLEQHLEALLALEPQRRVRNFLRSGPRIPTARGMFGRADVRARMKDRKPGWVVIEEREGAADRAARRSPKDVRFPVN